MINELPIVIFVLDDQKYALNCTVVRRILQAVDIPPVPNMPKDQLGVINLEGEIITIINIRHRLGLPDSQLSVNDFIVIADLSSMTIGFVVNDIDFAVAADSEIQKDSDVWIVKSSQGMIYMIDLEFLVNIQDKQTNDMIDTKSKLKEMRDRR